MNELRADEYERIRHACRRLTRTRSFRNLELDDLTQETAIRVARQRDGMRYVDRVARQTAGRMLDELGNRRNHEYPAGVHLPDPPDTAGADTGLRGDVERALRSLPARQEEVARLHGMYGWPQSAVASRLGVDQATVSRLWAQARSRLRLALGRYNVTVP